MNRLLRQYAIVALVSFWGAATSAAPPASATDAIEPPSCVVSDAQIAASTSGEHVELDLPGCSDDLPRVVRKAIRDVEGDYASFFASLHADLPTRTALAQLIARDKLLEGGWTHSSGDSGVMLEHHTGTGTAQYRAEVDDRLRTILTTDELDRLRKYREGVPGRYLIRPLLAKLMHEGAPLTDAQLDTVAPEIGRLLVAYASKSVDQSGGLVERCESSRRWMTQRDEQMLELLARHLNEQQLEIASLHYQRLFAERERRLTRYKEEVARDETAPCGTRLN